MEDGLLDLNASIETYLKDFPRKTFGGKNMDITVKDLCNHTSGIRGYFENIKKGKLYYLKMNIKLKKDLQ